MRRLRVPATALLLLLSLSASANAQREARAGSPSHLTLRWHRPASPRHGVTRMFDGAIVRWGFESATLFDLPTGAPAPPSLLELMPAERFAPEGSRAIGPLLVGLTLEPGGAVVAVDPRTMTVRWLRQLPSLSAIYAASDRLVVVGHHEPTGGFTGLDAATGEVRFSRALGSNERWVTSITPAGELLLAALSDGGLVGLDAASGRVRWRTAGSGLSPTWGTTLRIVGRRVVAFDPWRGWRELNLRDGRTVARHSRRSACRLLGVAGQLVLTIDCSRVAGHARPRALVAVHRGTGRVAWRVPWRGRLHEPVLLGGVLVGGLELGVRVVRDPASGRRIWRPAPLGRDTAYAEHDGRGYFITILGDELVVYERTATPPPLHPVVVEGNVDGLLIPEVRVHVGNAIATADAVGAYRTETQTAGVLRVVVDTEGVPFAPRRNEETVYAAPIFTFGAGSHRVDPMILRTR